MIKVSYGSNLSEYFDNWYEAENFICDQIKELKELHPSLGLDLFFYGVEGQKRVAVYKWNTHYFETFIAEEL